MYQPLSYVCPALLVAATCVAADAQQSDIRQQASTAMRTAATFYREQVASHGGYVYHYSLDLQQRWGEGEATIDQIWVQPPGTPTVGLAFLRAYSATGDKFYLDAATDAAVAIAYGQLKSGGWTNSVDFNPSSKLVADYRNGKGRGRNNSSLDDGQTQSAIQLMIHADKALNFQHKSIHECARIALDALLKAQFPNGGFPQVWTGPVEQQPVLRASFPDYDWRTEGRIKNYWDMYTLNDNVTGYVADTLLDAHRIYDDERYLQAVRNLGDFLLLAQMPEPQPGWAQQYSYQMQPIWARRFEPPGVSGDETQEVLETLVKIAQATGDRKYVEPIPRALGWLQRSVLPDGQIARYYELKTNRPLYMTRRGDKYSLTYDDFDLPSHYGWKTELRVEEIKKRYQTVGATRPTEASKQTAAPTEQQVKQVISDLDERGRWVSTYRGERLVGQAKFAENSQYLSSQVFSDNLTLLSDFLEVGAQRSSE
ncbi:MAG TPA: pectate lyase [Pirellulaceae bacterium]|nr:pectate lyase [Pirellulaceae bacterium]